MGKLRHITMLSVVLIVAASTASAQKYPVKPMRLISPFAPGGGTDILARGIATPIAESFGQPVVVDNRPGAGGTTGAELVARSAPDGYTLVIVSSSYATSSAYTTPSYDPIDGIQPIILFGTTGLVMSVHPSVPVKSVRELIDYAKANPTKLNYASVGPGSIVHFTHELFKIETGTNLVHVPYKGGGPALLATVAGEVQMTAISIVPSLPHVKAGRIRPIAVSTPTRLALLPDIPPIRDTVPGVEAIHWYGMWGPKGMPKAIVERWNKEIARILQADEMKARMKAEGLDLAAGPPQEFGDVLRRDIQKWRRVMREAKIKREG
jgi:tripartite-type tricarboxylate transporter receptor subunit TctC